MSEATAAVTDGISSGPSNQQIFDLLKSMQKDHQKLQERLEFLEGSKEAASVDAQSEFIGAIDQGTTSSRFLIFDKDGQPVASHQIEFKQIYPHSGYDLLDLC
jgi:glycerol kinase